MFLECLNLIKILPLLDEAVKRKGVAQNRLVSFLFQVHSILFTLHFIILSITACLPPIFFGCVSSIFMRHHFISQFTLENCFFFISFTSFNINGLSANDMNTDFFRRGGKNPFYLSIQWVKWIFFLRRLYILLLFSIFICYLLLMLFSV